ncbi:hypothetical protein VTO73DRAFT_12726 [Trametes versicolor]
MPPGPAYTWLCVASSVCNILSHAAHIRASQLSRARQAICETDIIARRRERDESYPYEGAEATSSQSVRLRRPVQSSPHGDAKELRNGPPETRRSVPGSRDVAGPTAEASLHPSPSPSEFKEPPSVTAQIEGIERPLLSKHCVPVTTPSEPSASADLPKSHRSVQATLVECDALPKPSPVEKRQAPSVEDVSVSTGVPGPGEQVSLDQPRNRNLQSSKVPSSRIGRLFHYGGLAASLGYGAASEILRRTTSGADEHAPSSLMLTEGNIKRLVSKLTQMRGAALKLGQFMSIQDSHVLPPEIEDIFRRVQDSAHYMPDWQMEQVMRDALGPSWMDTFESFDRLPFAAASIGQVHSAVLKASASPSGAPARVAVKVQFPNIVNSIASDLGYVKMLLTAGKLLPRGLFLDRTIQVMKEELADECDYAREAGFVRRFGQADHLGADPRFTVPWVWEGSTERVLRDRNDIAARIIELCLRELFVFRVMQTDPNWTNFLWNPHTRKVELVDFGATREYSKEFIDNWLHLLSAAVAEDRDACVEWSLKLGYLTGQENEVMLDAHVKSMVLLGTPFKATTPQPFTFGPGSAWADITAEIRAQIPVMLQHRLTPPPRETYSLNRKLSGAFLLASRLGAEVDCRKLWTDVVEGYRDMHTRLQGWRVLNLSVVYKKSICVPKS